MATRKIFNKRSLIDPYAVFVFNFLHLKLLSFSPILSALYGPVYLKSNLCPTSHF